MSEQTQGAVAKTGGHIPQGATQILEVEDIHTFYGSIEALKGITIDVHEGEVVTLIGSNGAGKSTTLRSISGLTPPRTGDIVFQGENITRTPPLPSAAVPSPPLCGAPSVAPAGTAPGWRSCGALMPGSRDRPR